MKAFNKRKLNRNLNDFNDLHEAEEHIRSYHISLQEKLQVLAESSKLKDLRNNTTTDYSPKNQIKRRFNLLNRLAKQGKNLFLTPFQSRITSIEKNLGLDVASYFIYSKWLFYHNFISFLVVLLPFIAVPHFSMIYNKLIYIRSLNSTSQYNETTPEILLKTCLKDDDILKFKFLDILVAEVSPSTSKTTRPNLKIKYFSFSQEHF